MAKRKERKIEPRRFVKLKKSRDIGIVMSQVDKDEYHVYLPFIDPTRSSPAMVLNVSDFEEVGPLLSHPGVGGFKRI